MSSPYTQLVPEEVTIVMYNSVWGMTSDGDLISPCTRDEWLRHCTLPGGVRVQVCAATSISSCRGEGLGVFVESS